ncbi:MAG: ribosome small subunit-dependent GTPase A, partial [Flavobacteriaceae bacterium]|nr:ribosome small subunit-dependent GTPase A [Flavobacteriaceae bacterium]
STNPIAVGDRVDFELEKKHANQGVIVHIQERKNYIIRKSVNLSKQVHIIAANLDCVFLLVTLNNPKTYTAFIDRFLVTAEAYSVPVVLLFNKIDGYNQEELLEVKYLAAMYREIGYTCIGISAYTGKNVDKVKDLMQNKVSMFVGHSGAGKSTLVNQIAPELDLKTAEISMQHQQGQHTTTFAEMFDVAQDMRIIDTPGIRGFGIVEMDKEEVGDYFPEFFALKSACKFSNCLHVNEPRCAVKDALDNNVLFWSRYRSYLQILEGDQGPYRGDVHDE